MQNGTLSGKTAVVIGASSGIGLATANLLSDSGATVHAAARRRSAIEEGAEGRAVSAHELDISDEKSVRRTVEGIGESQGIHVLVVAAGMNFPERRLGQLTGLYHAFVPSLLSYDGGQYGLAVLSRYPIRSTQRIPLRSAAEQRVLALVEVELDAAHVIPVAVTHFGTTGATERLNQAEDVKAALAGKPWALLGGDLNASPSESCITSLKALLSDAWTRGGSGNGYTHDASFPTRRIDYILLGSGWTSPVTAAVVGASSQSSASGPTGSCTRAAAPGSASGAGRGPPCARRCAADRACPPAAGGAARPCEPRRSCSPGACPSDRPAA